MAVLNKKEKLIVEAASGKDKTLAKVYDDMVFFFKCYDYLTNENNCLIIEYLYSKNHKHERFDCITQKFYISLSTLEERRKNIVKIFYFLLKETKNNAKTA